MKREMILIGLVLGLSGCAHLREPAEVQAAQQAAEAEDLIQMGMQLENDSARLRAVQDGRSQGVESRTPPPPAEAAEPEHSQIPLTGALSSKKFSMSMQDARIGQLLWVVAVEFNMGLSIDPAVLASDKTVNLFLKDVTGRQALIHVLQAFDVHGGVGEDNVLRVSPMEERIFLVDALSVKAALGLAAGGDAMGAGSASTGLRDSVTLSGGVGDEKTDVWSALDKTLEALLAGDEGGRRPRCWAWWESRPPARARPWRAM